VHRQIDRAVEQRLFDLLREQPLAARFGKRPVLDPVARGADRDQLDGRRGKPVDGDQRFADELRLLEGQRTAPRADPQNARSGRGLHLATSQCYASMRPRS
jgi:hypothetical protein